ncbi:MAG: histidine phosphatase family protein [Angelakisella sp.]|nr:histidine phosphatase family protein [Angelakisella sp.]
MKNYRLHFVRHGMTEENKSGCYQGRRTDPELSLEGIRQLIDLRESYEYPAVGIVYCSPMQRCVQTAGIIYPDRELIMMESLAEMDFGDFEGKTMAELQDDPDYLTWMEGGSLQVGPRGGETGEAFLYRVVDATQRIIKDMMENDITDAAVVTHGGVIMTILAGLGLPRQPMASWAVSNGRGYTTFVNPQMWLSSNVIEIAGIMPHGADKALVLNTMPDSPR